MKSAARDTAFDEVALHLSPRAGRFVSARTLAKIWEIPAREVRVLGDAGIAVQVEPDRFDIAQSTANYVAHLREQCAGRRGATDATSEIIVSANARLRETRTKLLNLRMDLEAGRLVRVDEAKERWNPLILATRQAILGLPGKLAFEIPTITQADRKKMDVIVRNALEAIAEGRDFKLDVDQVEYKAARQDD